VRLPAKTRSLLAGLCRIIAPMHWIAPSKKDAANHEVRPVRQSKFVIRHCPAQHDSTGRFDFVLANPPFNVNAVDTAK